MTAARPRTVGLVEQGGQRHLGPEHVPDPGHDLGGQQRVPAKLEEVVRRPDPVHPQHLGPDPGQQFLGHGGRGDEPAAGPGRAASGAGRAARSSFPAGVSGSAASSVNTAGIMNSGSRWRGEGLQRRRRPGCPRRGRPGTR